MLTDTQQDAIIAAMLRYDTQYFDNALNPVVPTVGQWFAEYTMDDDGVVVEGDIVEVVDVTLDHLQGVLAMVSSEDEEGCHASTADILILQAYPYLQVE